MPRLGLRSKTAATPRTKSTTTARTSNTTPARQRSQATTRRRVPRLPTVAQVVNALAQSLSNASLNASVAPDADQLPITSTPAVQRPQQMATNAMQRYDFGGTTSNANQSQPKRPSGLLCDKFAGNTGTDGIEVKEWLRIFEIQVEDYTDREKIKTLSRHLTEHALKWFAIEEMTEQTEYNVVREALIKRFSRARGLGINEATDRRLRSTETVESYYNDMRRILLSAKQSDECQVEFLTRGMPDSYRLQIAALRPKTPQDWLEIAISIEDAKRRRFSKPTEATNYSEESCEAANRSKDDRRNKFRGEDRKKYLSRTQPNSDLPAEPCPRCQKQYGLMEYHWKRLCPREDKNQTTPKSVDPTSGQTTSQIPVAGDSALVPHTGHSNSLINGFIHCEVFVNDIKVRAFCDSGSTLTAVSKEFAEKLGIRLDDKTSITVRMVEGSTYTLGSFDAKIQIGNKIKTMRVHVFPNLQHEALIGLDVATAFGLTLDFRSGRIHVNYHLDAQSDIKDENEVLKSDDNNDIIETAPQNTNVNSIEDDIFERQHEIRSYKLRSPKTIKGFVFVGIRGRNLLVVPPSLVPKILKETHDHKRLHFDAKAMIRTIATRYWWPKRDKDVHTFVKSCQTCASNRQKTTPKRRLSVANASYVMSMTIASQRVRYSLFDKKPKIDVVVGLPEPSNRKHQIDSTINRRKEPKNTKEIDSLSKATNFENNDHLSTSLPYNGRKNERIVAKNIEKTDKNAQNVENNDNWPKRGNQRYVVYERSPHVIHSSFCLHSVRSDAKTRLDSNSKRLKRSDNESKVNERTIECEAIRESNRFHDLLTSEESGIDRDFRGGGIERQVSPLIDAKRFVFT